MTNKAYIVANEEQEREVLGVLQANGIKQVFGTYSQFRPLTGFPYVIHESVTSNVLTSYRLPKLEYSTEIIYDGRKESGMSISKANKMKISKEVYDVLAEWRSVYGLNDRFTVIDDLRHLPDEVEGWYWDGGTRTANNQRLLAIIRFAMGEQPFEIEKPKKWVVRSKDTDNTGDYGYVSINQYNITFNAYHISSATKFDTREEAESWANSHQEVIEVELDE
jgi:hypothetical protein